MMKISIIKEGDLGGLILLLDTEKTIDAKHKYSQLASNGFTFSPFGKDGPVTI